MTRYTIDKDDLFVEIKAGPLTTVKVTHLIYDVTGVGYAKLNLPDTYDESFGIVLAGSRAAERMNRKLQKKLIKSLG